MYDSFDEMAAANQAAGQYWFSEGALSFFASEFSLPIHKTDQGAYFVSSEQGPESGTPGRTDYYRPARRFSLRFINSAAEVSTVGEFQQYATAAEAHAAAEMIGSLRIELEHADRLYQDREGEGYRAHRYAVQATAKRLGFTLSDG